MITRLEEAASYYDTQFHSLMKSLREKGDQYGGTIRFLTFRLDFNSETIVAASAEQRSGSPGRRYKDSKASPKADSSNVWGPDGHKLPSFNADSSALLGLSDYVVSKAKISSATPGLKPSSRLGANANSSSSNSLLGSGKLGSVSSFNKK